VSIADDVVKVLPKTLRDFGYRHRELIKFAIVGATTFVIDSGIFYILKLTVLSPKPITAKIISGVIAVIASYVLNREWSFKGRGGRERHHEALLFFVVSGIGVLLSNVPLWISRYVFHLQVPNVSLTTENIADFVSAFVIGNILQMVFRFWSMRRWVFPVAVSDGAVSDGAASGVAGRGPLESRSFPPPLRPGGPPLRQSRTGTGHDSVGLRRLRRRGRSPGESFPPPLRLGGSALRQSRTRAGHDSVDGAASAAAGHGPLGPRPFPPPLRPGGPPLRQSRTGTGHDSVDGAASGVAGRGPLEPRSTT
jgi:putative flippase GtrA